MYKSVFQSLFRSFCSFPTSFSSSSESLSSKRFRSGPRPPSFFLKTKFLILDDLVHHKGRQPFRFPMVTCTRGIWSPRVLNCKRHRWCKTDCRRRLVREPPDLNFTVVRILSTFKANISWNWICNQILAQLLPNHEKQACKPRGYTSPKIYDPPTNPVTDMNDL